MNAKKEKREVHVSKVRGVVVTLAFAMAIVSTALSVYLIGELQKDVVNVYCSSGLHADPCDSLSAWWAADRGRLTCGGEYDSLLGYCFEPGEYEGRRAAAFGSFSLVVALWILLAIMFEIYFVHPREKLEVE